MNVTPVKLNHREPCPECGAPLVERTSRFGLFLGCSMFPKCCGKRGVVEKDDDYWERRDQDNAVNGYPDDGPDY